MYQSEQKAKEALVKEQREIIETIKEMLEGTGFDGVIDEEYKDRLSLGYDNIDSLIYGKYKAFREQEADIIKDAKMRERFEKMKNYVNKYNLDQVYEKQQ